MTATPLTPRPILGTNPDGTSRITQTITPSRFGYHCTTTHGLFTGGRGLFSFTRRGIERKANRLARKLHQDDLRHLDAQERTWTPTGIPTTDLRLTHGRGAMTHREPRDTRTPRQLAAKKSLDSGV